MIPLRRLAQAVLSPLFASASVCLSWTSLCWVLSSGVPASGLQTPPDAATPAAAPSSGRDLKSGTNDEPVRDGTAANVIPDGPSIDLSTLRFYSGSLLGEVPEADQGLFDWIQSNYAKMPEDTRDVPPSGEELMKVQRLVDSMIEGGWRHRLTYPKSPHRAQVAYYLARLHGLNQARFIDHETKTYKAAFSQNMPPAELAELQFQYLRPILALAADGIAQDPKPLLRSQLLASVGDAHKMASGPFYSMRDYPRSFAANLAAAQAFDRARKLVTPHPEDVDLRIRLIDSLLGGRKFDRAAVECQSFIDAYPKSRYTPHIFFWLHTSLRRSGRLEEGLALWKKWTPALEAGTEGKPMPEFLGGGGWIPSKKAQEGYGLYRNRARFYQGFYHYALLHFGLARSLFGDFLISMNVLEGENRLGMAAKVYRDAMAYFLNKNLHGLFADPSDSDLPELIGKPAPPLTVGNGWVQPFAEGSDRDAKCYVVLFCSLTNAETRRHELFGTLQDLVTRRYGDGVRVCWVSSGTLSKNQDAESEKAKVREFMTTRGLEWPAAIDLDPTLPVWFEYSIHRGSAHLFVADGATRMQWQLVDPMGWDARLIEAVVDRVLASQK